MIEMLRPKEYLESIYQVDFDALKKKGIKGLILDLDETLLPREMLDISPVLFAFIEKLKEMFSIFLLSNSLREERLEYVGRTFKIPYMTLSLKPLPFAFETARRQMRLRTEEIAVIGDQLFMDALGGNWSKMYTILVKPMNPETLWLRKLMRFGENIILKRLGLS